MGWREVRSQVTRSVCVPGSSVGTSQYEVSAAQARSGSSGWVGTTQKCTRALFTVLVEEEGEKRKEEAKQENTRDNRRDILVLCAR